MNTHDHKIETFKLLVAGKGYYYFFNLNIKLNFKVLYQHRRKHNIYNWFSSFLSDFTVILLWLITQLLSY